MIVLDASVIAKWFLEEPESSSALYYRDLHLKRKEIIIVPHILVYEIANLLLYKNFTEKEIISVLESLENFKIEVISLNFSDMVRVAILAKEREITAYDATYVLLARNFGCKFITADKKLYKKVKDLNFIELLS